MALSTKPERTLPHRPPFVWVHRLIERSDDGSAGVVEFDCTPELDIFKGHFPGRPIFPGVLQMEAQAQACLWVLLGELPPGAALPEVFFVAVDSYKFKKPVVPPATLTLKVKKERDRSGMQLWNCEAYVGADLVSFGTFWLKISRS